MNPQPDQASEVELTFNVESSVYQTLVKETHLQRLTYKDFWEEEIKNWVSFIRNDPSKICPEIVRMNRSISLGVEFTDDNSIIKLNNFWRNKKENTDVLSFPAIDQTMALPQGTCIEIGDIIISVQTAQRQAIEMKHNLETELRWLLSHGLLHLLGWDHLNTEDLNAMLTCQEYLLNISSNIKDQSLKVQTLNDTHMGT